MLDQTLNSPLTTPNKPQNFGAAARIMAGTAEITAQPTKPVH